MNKPQSVATTREETLPAEVQEFLEKERQREISEHGVETPAIEVIHGKELFQMPDGKTCKTFEGVMLAEQRVNIRWTEESDLPDCVAPDAMNGSKHGKCATCEFNQFGSDPKGGAGKDCKNQSVLLLWRTDEPTHVPFRITVSPTGLKNDRAKAAREIRKAASGSGLPALGVIAEFSLEHGSGSGKEWSVLTAKSSGKSLRTGDITPTQLVEFRRIADACQSHAVDRAIAESGELGTGDLEEEMEMDRQPDSAFNNPNVQPQEGNGEDLPF